MKSTRALILLYGLLSAALYSGLLPLWEGFDELYHYGYVQHLANAYRFPVADKTPLSLELWTSLDDVPVSHYLQPHVYRPSFNFEEYFRLPAAERRARREALDRIPKSYQAQPSARDNYEAKQSPVTYLLLAPVEWLLSGAPLPLRVFVLRLLLSAASAVLLWIGTRRLSLRLRLPAAMENAALLTIFSCQMLYATIAHVSNEALTIPWLLFFLAAAIDSYAAPSVQRTAMAAVLLAVGLLLKASLLFFAPVIFFRRSAKLLGVSAGVLMVLAGPWYLRNLVLYRNLTATNDTTSGVGIGTLLRAAGKLPWVESVGDTAHRAVWTGNNSFTSFSGLTLNIVLGLLAVALVLYLLRMRRSLGEVVTLGAVGLYLGGMVLVTLSFFSATFGAVIGPMPWYTTILIAPLALLAFLGLGRTPRWGRWIAIAGVLLSSYIAAVSWVAKLVPLYGGFSNPHARFGELMRWYFQQGELRDSILGPLCPAPVGLIYGLLVAVLVSLCVAGAKVVRGLVTELRA